MVIFGNIAKSPKIAIFWLEMKRRNKHNKTKSFKLVMPDFIYAEKGFKNDQIFQK